MGLLVSDWMFVGVMVTPGLLLDSVVFMVLLPSFAYFYARVIKSSKPVGWTTSRLQYFFSKKRLIAGLEKNEGCLLSTKSSRD